MSSVFSQLFPPHPSFTEKELPDLTGKVALITGSASGIGLALAIMLHRRNCTVYIAARSATRVSDGVEAVQAAVRGSKGRLEGLVIDLADLSSVKAAAEGFLVREREREGRLDVLVHNAGVMFPPEGQVTAQGYDLEMGTNCLGPFLLNKLLEPILQQTAQREKLVGSVRVVWLTSTVALGSPKGGVILDVKGKPNVLKGRENYMQTKCGNIFMAAESAKKPEMDGVLSVSVNPGVIMTDLQRHLPGMVRAILGLVFKSAEYGAYSELFAAFSPQVTVRHNGEFLIPWGRHGNMPRHLAESLKRSADGGKSIAERFYDWCDRETLPYR